MFLSVITRTYKRPGMLEINRASLAAQSDPDYEHLLLVDEVGWGVAAAQLALHDVEVNGEYALVLDDDDRLVYPELIAELKELDASGSPDVFVVKMDHGPLGVLPDEWETRDIPRGHIGVSAVIVSRALWQRYRTAFTPRYDGDYDYVTAVLHGAERLVWLDRVVSAVQRISAGQPETSGVLYIGNGHFMQGVPARDLNAAEWNALSPELQATLCALGLYCEAVKRARTWDAGKISTEIQP